MRYAPILMAASAAALVAGTAAAAPQGHSMRHGGGGLHGRMIPIMVAVLDANGDGAVSLDEVDAVHKRLFDRMDANKDGKLTPDEMGPPMKMRTMTAPAEPPSDGAGKPGMKREEVIIRREGPGMMGGGMMGHDMMGHGMMGNPMIIAAMDTNNDGALSFEEMEAVHKRIFTLIDANKDGKVTAEEAEAFFKGE